MGMRETVRSLAVYFIVVGVIGSASYIWAMVRTPQDVPLLVICLLGVLFSLVYLYMGVCLRRLLLQSPRFITTVLLISLCLVVVSFLLHLAQLTLVQAVISIAWVGIIIYLLFNVRRLSREERAKAVAQTPAPPPGDARESS